MRFSDGLMLVWRNLLRRKSRTFLTALGVAIGTASIVGMIALALGLKENAIQSFDNFQDITVLDVYPGWNEMPGQNDLKLTDKSVAELKKIPGVVGVMPQLGLYGSLELQMGRMVGEGIHVIGIDVTDADKFGLEVEQGSFLTGAKNEGVISYLVPDYMYQKQRKSRNSKEEEQAFFLPGQQETMARTRPDMVNKTVNLVLTKYTGEDKLENKSFKVRIQGMLSEGKGQWGPVIYLNLDLVREMNQWLGYSDSESGAGRRGKNQTEYEMVRVKVAGRNEVEQVVEQIKSLGYQTWSPMEAIREINSFFLVVQLILGGIGAISLLVASIGIMNTMFMSILERTREIGIMKVLGATIPNIRKMFLLEAGLIGCLGGISGLLGSFIFVSLVNLVPQSNMFGLPGEEIDRIAVIPLWLALFAFAFSIFIGVLSGLLPAQRAAKISPLQALRQE